MDNGASIPVRGRIKETARVYMIVKPQRAGWITSYTPVVSGYMMQMYNMPISSLKIVTTLFQVLYNQVFN